MSVYYERSELSSVSNGAIYKNYNVCVCVQCRMEDYSHSNILLGSLTC